jgi:hypothetical protein
VNGMSKFWAAVMLALIFLSAVNATVAVYELSRWRRRDAEFMENRRRIERLEGLMLERAR